MSAAAAPAPFALRTVLLLAVLGVVGFLSFLLLSAYADDLRPAQNGGPHALSNSATGYAGLAALVKATHGKVELIRRDADLDAIDRLVVLTPSMTTSPELLRKILARRDYAPTIIVLPKWITRPRPDRPGWVEGVGVLPSVAGENLLDPITPVTLTDPVPGTELRTIAGRDLTPVMTDSNGRMLVAQIRDRLTLIVADADLLDNRGMKTLAGAERALKIVDQYAPGGNIAFDLTLHGFGRNPNLLKLAFEPPFLPLTLCLIAAALLAGWHAMLRFGPTLPERRGIAFGKRAIAENGAALLRLARRRHRTGERYAALIRDAAAAGTGAPSNLGGDALDRYLDRLAPEGEPFTAMAARAASASDTRGLLSAARALYQWKRTVTREH